MKNFLSHSLNIGSVLIRGRNSDNPDPISEAYAVLCCERLRSIAHQTIVSDDFELIKILYWQAALHEFFTLDI